MKINHPPFSLFLKPLSDMLFTELDLPTQIGVALCLALAIDAAPNSDLARLVRMLPRFEKLLKCESFKAKSMLLVLIVSISAPLSLSKPRSFSLSLSLSLKSQPRYKYLILRFKKLI